MNEAHPDDLVDVHIREFVLHPDRHQRDAPAVLRDRLRAARRTYSSAASRPSAAPPHAAHPIKLSLPYPSPFFQTGRANLNRLPGYSGTRTTSRPSGIRTLPVPCRGIRAFLNPMRAAPASRCCKASTERTSPVGPTLSDGRHVRVHRLVAVARRDRQHHAKSAAGSLSCNPPMTLIYPSHIPMFSPPRFSSTANSRFARLKSKPSVVRRGTLKLVRATSAWISVITGRDPPLRMPHMSPAHAAADLRAASPTDSAPQPARSVPFQTRRSRSLTQSGSSPPAECDSCSSARPQK